MGHVLSPRTPEARAPTLSVQHVAAASQKEQQEKKRRTRAPAPGRPRPRPRLRHLLSAHCRRGSLQALQRPLRTAAHSPVHPAGEGANRVGLCSAASPLSLVLSLSLSL